MEDAIQLFREGIYEPLGKVLEGEGDQGFVTKGPEIVRAFYGAHPDVLENLATKHAESGYTRKKVICDNGRHAARCMEWAPGAISPIHEHGHRVCFDIVLSGELTVVDYRPHVADEKENLYRLEEVRRYTAKKGEFVVVNPMATDYEAHDVTTVGERAKSLHFYPVDHRDIAVYEPAERGLYRKVTRSLADD
jgi:hypothetical protein